LLHTSRLLTSYGTSRRSTLSVASSSNLLTSASKDASFPNMHHAVVIISLLVKMKRHGFALWFSIGCILQNRSCSESRGHICL